jgi:preprotein translocase subunit SecB
MAKRENTNGSKKPDMIQALPLVNNVHYVKDLSFENPGILKNLSEPGQAPQIGINIQVEVKNLAPHVFEVVLLVEAKADVEKETLFLVELSYGGIFTVAESVTEADSKPLLLIEAPRLLFPFARSIVANMTRDGGLPPLLMNPVDFASLYREQHQSELSS